MAKQAESEREKRAKIIHASGELEASRAAHAGGRGAAARSPWPCTCATCRRSTEIAAEKNSTIIFPVPIDWMQALIEKAGGKVRPRVDIPLDPLADDDLTIRGQIETTQRAGADALAAGQPARRAS